MVGHLPNRAQRFDFSIGRRMSLRGITDTFGTGVHQEVDIRRVAGQPIQSVGNAHGCLQLRACLPSRLWNGFDFSSLLEMGVGFATGRAIWNGVYCGRSHSSFRLALRRLRSTLSPAAVILRRARPMVLTRKSCKRAKKRRNQVWSALLRRPSPRLALTVGLASSPRSIRLHPDSF